MRPNILKIPRANLLLALVLMCSSANAGFFDELKKGAESLKKGAQDIRQSVEDTYQAKETVEKILPESEDQKSQDHQSIPSYNQNAQLVRETQSQLNRLGYKVSVDGAYGPGTKNAILQFQKNQGLNQTGDVSPELIRTLGQTNYVAHKSSDYQASQTQQNQSSAQSILPQTPSSSNENRVLENSTANISSTVEWKIGDEAFCFLSSRPGDEPSVSQYMISRVGDTQYPVSILIKKDNGQIISTDEPLTKCFKSEELAKKHDVSGSKQNQKSQSPTEGLKQTSNSALSNLLSVNQASVAHQAEGLFNRSIIAYKLKPELLDKIDWEAIAKEQIERDQSVYRIKNNSHPSMYVPFFNREEVMGRQVEFIVRSLTPKFKNTVLDGINQTSVRLDFEIPLNYLPPKYNFEKGTLESGNVYDRTYQVNVQGKHYYMDNRTSRALSEYEDSLNILGMPQIFTERFLRSQAILAFDRWVTITNYKLPPSEAERFLLETSGNQDYSETFQYNQEVYGRRKATALFVSGTINDYSEIGEGRKVKQFFTVEVEKAEIRNAEDKVLLSFDKSDFPFIADKAAEQKAKEAGWEAERLAEQKAAEDTKREEKERKYAEIKQREEDRIAQQEAVKHDTKEKISKARERRNECNQIKKLQDRYDCLDKFISSICPVNLQDMEGLTRKMDCEYIMSKDEYYEIREDRSVVLEKLSDVDGRKNEVSSFILQSCNHKYRRLAQPPLFLKNPDYKKAYASCETQGLEILETCKKEFPATKYGTVDEFESQDQADALTQCVYDRMFSGT